MNISQLKSYIVTVLKTWFRNKSTLDRLNVNNNNKLTFDNIEVTSAPQIELTQAEYDALSYEEQHNGTEYFITDASYTNQVIYVGNKIDKSNIYSTQERIIGCWTDGRPLYQIVVTGTAPNELNTIATITTINNKNIKEVCFLKSVLKRTSGAVYSIDLSNLIKLNETTDLYPTSVWAGAPDANNNVDIKCRISHTRDISASIISVVQYTKTTDTENSYKLGDENDYSTEEHIIGTWIDGKPVYQKTIINTMPTVITDYIDVQKTIPITDLKISEIIKYDSYVKLYSNIVINMNDVWKGNNDMWIIRNYVSPTEITISSNRVGFSDRTYRITLQYTKTTD